MATTHGPMFDGEASALAAAMCDRIEQDLGDQGESMVRVELGRVLQHPTGRYESSITAAPTGAGIDISDGGIVYGPWLEGVGSRNRTTRFKGYATFRRVAQALDARAEALIEPTVSSYVRRMG